MLLDGSLEGGRVGADDLADLLAVLEDEESGHGADGVLLGGLGDLVNVNLEEAGVGVVVGEPVGGGVSEGVLFMFVCSDCLLFACAASAFLLFFGFVIGFWGCARNTHLTTWGAMTLQGPHQVAKKSTTITPDSLRAASKSALLHGRKDNMLVFCAVLTDRMCRKGALGCARRG